MRPKTENSIDQGSGNTQIGHNTGEIYVGLTFEQHQQALHDALASKTADLERAHGAEKDIIRREADELRRRLAEVETDYKQRVEELAVLKAELAKYQNRFEKEKFEAANSALDYDNSSLAETLFKELLKATEARREDAERDEASLHFRLGKIAEDGVRWHDAYTHYKRATELHDTPDHLKAYARITWRLAKREEAIIAQKKLVKWAKSVYGPRSAAFGTELNNLAVLVQHQGRYAEAEELWRKALDIMREALGADHPDYAQKLNNLATGLEEQGRFREAEELYREALQIDAETIGTTHPDYAAHLNNLARLMNLQGRYAEAETLHRDALEIGRNTIGINHPLYAIRLNNLGSVVQAQGRYDEAEVCYRQALSVFSETVGEVHPEYAKALNNLAGVVQAQKRYKEAETLYRDALKINYISVGEGHPEYAVLLNNLADNLATQGKCEQARCLLEQALEVFCDTLPPNHRYILGTTKNLANLP